MIFDCTVTEGCLINFVISSTAEINVSVEVFKVAANARYCC